MADAAESVFNHHLTGLRGVFRSLSVRINVTTLIPIAIFCMVWGFFVLLRLQFAIMLTDTDYYMTGPRVFSWNALINIWRDTPPGWYRPVAFSAEYVLLAFMWKNFTALILLQMLIPAGSAVLLYYVARDISNENRLLAAAAATIYSFSLGVIEVSWLFVHKSILTDFLVLCAVLGYLRYLKTGRFSWFALMVFGALTLPWAREIGASVTAALFGAALLQRRRDTLLLSALFALSLHGVFSAFLTNLHLFHKVQLTSIFERSDWGLGLPFGSHHTLDVPFKVVLYLSPIATIMMLVSMVLFYLGQGKSRAYLATPIAAVSVISIVTLFSPQSSQFTGIMALAFGALIIIANLPRSKLLPLWFACSMAPFIVMPAHDAWLRLAGMPYIIMTLLWIADLPANLRVVLHRLRTAQSGRLPSPNCTSERTPAWSLLPATVFGVLVLIAVNNLVISFVTFRKTIALEKRMASWLTTATAKGAALVSSVRLLPDVQYYSDNWIDARYIRLPFTFPLPGGQVPALGKLDAVTLSHAERGVYFMVSDKYGRVGYPDGVSGDELEPAKAFAISARYPMLDPFQAIMPERYRRYGGPTDTLHEFRLIHRPFSGEARAVFRFYKLNRQPKVVEEGYKGFKVVKWGDAAFLVRHGEPRFVPEDMFGSTHSVVGFGHTVREAKRSLDSILARTQNLTVKTLLYESYAGFDIHYLNSHFYAIPSSAPPFDLAAYRARRYPEAFDGGSPGLVKLQIDDMYLTGVPPYAPADYHPALLVRNYKGFSIYSFRGSVYGILRSEGPFDYDRFARDDYAATAGLFKASFETVMRQIDSGQHDLTPRFLMEGFHGYDLLAYGSKFYAIPQREAAFDYRRFRNHGYRWSAVGSSLDAVKDDVLRHVSQSTPISIGDYAGHTIAMYRGDLYAAPSGQDPNDLRKPQRDRNSLWFRGSSFSDIRTAVAEHVLEAAPLTPLYDDAGRGWAAESGVSVTKDARVVKPGGSSLKVVWSTSSGATFYNFASRQDWSRSHIVGFYAYGSGSGATMAFQVRFKDQGGPNWVDFHWEDDFTGWRPMVFELNKPSTHSGLVDWTDVQQVVIRPLDAKGFTLYFDRVARDGALPLMISDDYIGFAVAKFGPKYYAIPRAEGKLDLQKLLAGGYTRALSGSSLSEVTALIARSTLAKAPRLVSNDDVSMWRPEAGVEVKEENHIVQIGVQSLKASWKASSGAVYLNFPGSQDWSVSKYLILWVYGAGGGEIFALQLRYKDQGGPNWEDFLWKDDFIGWRPLVFELMKPSTISGTVDWTNVQQVLIRPLEKVTATLYLNHLIRYP